MSVFAEMASACAIAPEEVTCTTLMTALREGGHTQALQHMIALLRQSGAPVAAAGVRFNPVSCF